MAEYSYKTLANEGREKTFRCKVLGESAATLLVNHRPIRVNVRETSGSGFTLGIDPPLAKKIKSGKHYAMRYDDRRMEVVTEALVEANPGESLLLVRMIREFEPKERWSFRIPFARGARAIAGDSGIDSGTVYAAFVLMLFCVMALPGIGDKLGTAHRIESALQLVGKNLNDAVQSFRR